MDAERKTEVNRKIALWMGWCWIPKLKIWRQYNPDGPGLLGYEQGASLPDYFNDRAASMEVLEKLVRFGAGVHLDFDGEDFYASRGDMDSDCLSLKFLVAIALAAEQVIDAEAKEGSAT